MTSSNLLRWGGLAALIGGVLYVLTGIMSLLATQKRCSTHSLTTSSRCCLS
jgi:hypothetical protein